MNGETIERGQWTLAPWSPGSHRLLLGNALCPETRWCLNKADDVIDLAHVAADATGLLVLAPETLRAALFAESLCQNPISGACTNAEPCCACRSWADAILARLTGSAAKTTPERGE